jgi:predicted PurR-regulated permease PerM
MKQSAVKPPDWTVRQVVLATLTAAFVVVAFWVLYQYRSVLFIFVVGIVLGTAMRPAVISLADRGFAREYGGLIIYVLILFLILLILFGFLPTVAAQGANLAVEIPGIYSVVRSNMLESSSRLFVNLALHLPPTLEFFIQARAEEVVAFSQASRFFQLSGALGRGFLITLSIFLIAYFWSLESDQILLGLSLMFSSRLRIQAREFIKAIEDRVGAFVRGQLILCLIIGGLALIAYRLIGLPNSLVLGIMAGVFEAVPVVGPTLGAIPAILVALSIGPTSALWVIVVTLIIQGLENYFLLPRIMGKSVGVNPIVTLLALATFTSWWGLTGALLAIPIAAVFQLLVDRFLLSPEAVEYKSLSGRDRISLLRYETQRIVDDIHKKLREKSDASSRETDKIEDAIEALAIDLDHILSLREEEA